MAKLDVKGIFFDFDDTLQSRKGAYRLYCESFLDKYFPGISEEERLTKQSRQRRLQTFLLQIMR